MRSHGSRPDDQTMRPKAGSTLVEFALAAPLLFLLLFSLFDLSRLLYVQATLQAAVSEAARFAVTGQRLADPDNPEVFLSREDSIRAELNRHAVALRRGDLDVRVTDGGPLGTLEVRARYPYRWMLPSLFGLGPALLLEARAVMRNENFPEGRP